MRRRQQLRGGAPPPSSVTTRVCRASFGTSSSGGSKTTAATDSENQPKSIPNNNNNKEDNNNNNNTGLFGLPEGTAGPASIMTGAMFFNNLGFGCVVPVLPLFATSMGLGPTGVGTILSTSALARLLMNIPMGRAADKLGRKPVMVAGGATIAMASVATGVCWDLNSLLACRLAVGCGGSAATAATGAYMADLTAPIPDQRAKLFGAQNTIVSLAYAVGPAIGGSLCDLCGARNMFFVVGAANTVCTLGYGLLPESSAVAAATKDDTTTTKPNTSGGDKDSDDDDDDSAWTVYRELLQNPDRQGIMALNFGIFCSYSAIMTIFPLHASELLGEAGTASNIGLLFAGFSVISFPAMALGGYLADTIGRKRTIIPAVGLIAAGAVAMAGVETTAVAAQGMQALAVPIGLWGIGGAMASPGLTAFAVDIARDPRQRSQALALSNSANDLSFLVCPISLGALAQATDCSTALLATGGIITGLNLAFALRTTEPDWKGSGDGSDGGGGSTTSST